MERRQLHVTGCSVLAVLTLYVFAAPVRADDDVCQNSTFVVRRGDSLWRIGRELLIDAKRVATPKTIKSTVLRIFADNGGVIGSDPNRLHPGQRLVIGPLRTCKLLPNPPPPQPKMPPSQNAGG
jgi:hypothetical protein